MSEINLTLVAAEATKVSSKGGLDNVVRGMCMLQSAKELVLQPVEAAELSFWADMFRDVANQLRGVYAKKSELVDFCGSAVAVYDRYVAVVCKTLISDGLSVKFNDDTGRPTAPSTLKTYDFILHKALSYDKAGELFQYDGDGELIVRSKTSTGNLGKNLEAAAKKARAERDLANAVASGAVAARQIEKAPDAGKSAPAAAERGNPGSPAVKPAVTGNPSDPKHAELAALIDKIMDVAFEAPNHRKPTRKGDKVNDGFEIVFRHLTNTLKAMQGELSTAFGDEMAAVLNKAAA